MPRAACRLVSLLALVLLIPYAPYAPLAQTRAQNDKAAADAVKNKGLPLLPERPLSFTTSEATWLSLDVSTDGKTIVFELLGDLYTLPISGGEATRITNGQAYDMQPAFSPDGKKLVFISDRNGSENVWVANADGTKPRAITTTERESYMSPTWTPDGDYVIAAKGAQLWMYHESGGSGVQMTGVSAGPAPAAGPGPAAPTAPAILGPAFGKDPESLWVNVRGTVRAGLTTRIIEDESHPDYDPHTPLRSSPRSVAPYQIAQLDRESGRLLVRTHEHEGAFRPVPSPDGKWLVYSTRYDARQALKLIDLSTGEDRWLRMDVQRDDSQGGGARDRDVYPKSAFTPDSASLITSYDGRIWRVSVPTGEAVEIPFTAKVDQQLGPLVRFDYPIDDEKLRVSQIRGARPSPDGKRVVFTALDRLWIADLPQGRGTKREKRDDADKKLDADAADKPAADKPAADATRTPASEPQVKPAVEAPPAPVPTIRNARRLTTRTEVEHGPVWSPDGQFIAYVTWNDDDGGRIYRVRADGRGQPERLTTVAAFYDKLTYSRDGSRLIGVRGSKMHRMRTLEDFGNHSGSAELEYVWLPATGGTVSRIAWAAGGSTQQGREAPHVGPDPTRVYVWAGSEGLLSMRYDGTDIKTIVKVTAPAPPPQPGAPPGPPPTPDEVVLSPDGKRALVRANRNVYLISPFFNDVVRLGAASGITYTPTLIVSYGGPIGRQHYLTNGMNVDEEQRLRRFTPHDELDKWKNTDWNRADQYVFPLHAKQLTKWVNGGGKVGLGSHGEVQGIGAHWELWMVASGGMKPHAALKAATIDGADAIGFAKDLGSLEVGKLADLIVLDANPLDDIKNTAKIAEVMKNGRLYDAATLNETYPRQKALDQQWWWKVEPPAPPAHKRSGS